MKPVRTFVAVELTPEIRTRANQLIGALRRVVADVRWSPPENMHLTLKFLGDVEVLEVPRVCDAVKQAVRDATPFNIEIRGAGAFPDSQRPRTVWLGVGEGAEELARIHERLEAALAPLGFREECRRYRPHLTLGRVRDSQPGSSFARALAAHETYAAGAMMVGEVAVVSSELSRSGSKYEVLGHIDFGGE